MTRNRITLLLFGVMCIVIFLVYREPSTSDCSSLEGIIKSHLRLVEWSGTSFYVWHSKVSNYVITGGGDEGHITSAFIEVLTKSSPQEGVVVDIGANTGIYGLYAASLGYTVHFVDFQPVCIKYIQTAIVINHLEQRTKIHPFPLARTNSHRMKVSDLSPCIGVFRSSSSTQFTRINREQGIDALPFYEVTTRRFDELWEKEGSEQIVLMKIDVEGFEVEVLGGMWELFREQRVTNLIVEVTPHFWLHDYRFNRTQLAHELIQLWDWGYQRVLRWDLNGSTVHFDNREQYWAI